MKAYDIQLSETRDYHIHTNMIGHASPLMSLDNIVQTAQRKGLEEIAVTEHVRRSSNWVCDYVRVLRGLKTELRVLIGFEAKVLASDGELDIDPILAEEHLVIGSFHTFDEPERFFEANVNLAQNPCVDIIGHLGLCNDRKLSLSPEQERELVNVLKMNQKVVELNSRYCLPASSLLCKLAAAGVRLCYGSDAHALDEIGRFKWRLPDEI